MSREAMKLALEALETVAADVKTTPTAYEAQRQAITALREALVNEALDKKADNARELGLDYEPSAGTQVSKVWWDGERLMAKPIPFVEFYRPVQQEPVAILHRYPSKCRMTVEYTDEITEVREGSWPLYTIPPQSKPLTDEEIILIVADCASSHQHTDIHFARAIEAKLKEKNNG